MDNEAKFSNKGVDSKGGGSKGGNGSGGKGRSGKIKGGKSGRGKVNSGKKVRLQEYLDSLIELHKLQHVLLSQMDKEI